MDYVITEELLKEVISGLQTYAFTTRIGRSATQETVYKLSTLPPIGYENFTVGMKVWVYCPARPDKFIGTIEAIHFLGPTVGDKEGCSWVVKWNQIHETA